MFSPTKIALLLSGLFTGLATNAVPFANRNHFIDGRFDQWTATSASAVAGSLTYVAPTMWAVGAGTGGAATVSRIDLRTTANLAYTESGAPYALQFQQTVASTGTVAASTAPLITQKIEGLSKFAGRSVTMQIKLWAAANMTIPSIVLRQGFGSGGSPSAQVVLDKAVTWNVTTTPKKFNVRLDIPSISGKTLGTAGDDSLQVGLWLPPGVTFTLTMTEAQFELCDSSASSDTSGAGGAPTAYEFRGDYVEFGRVARLYQTGSTRMELVNTNYFGTTHRFSTPMSRTPAVGVTDGAGTSGKYTSASGGNGRTPSGGSLAQNASTLGFETDALAQATGEGNWALIGWIADCRL